MNATHGFSKMSVVCAVCGMLFAAGIWMRGQAVQAQPAPQAITVGGVEISGLPDDWTHHHLVFSNPGTEEEAMQNGAHETWLKTVNDPRYIIQQLKRRAPAQGPAAAAVARLESLRTAGTAQEAGLTAGPLLLQALRKPRRALERENPHALAIAGLQLAMLALGLAFAATFLWRRQWAPTLVLVLSTAVFVLLTSCGGASNSGGTAFPQAINSDWQMNLGTSPAMSAGQYPAKYSFSTTAAGLCSTSSTPDYVVYPTGVAGSTSQANIIAYDNIYSGCTGTKPTVYWSYYTGTGTAATSPVLSLNGTKVAFIETPSSGASILRILKWSSGNGTDNDSPDNITSTDNHTNTYAGASGNTAWSSCSTSPCMISVAFQTQTNTDTTSSPWYDYSSDTLYVGDSAGYLHQFTGVFNGTPGESTNHASPGTCGTGCKWPINIDAGTGGTEEDCNGTTETTGAPLTGPVFDNTQKLAFVGIQSFSTTSEGFLVSVTTASGTTAAIQATSCSIGQEPTTDITDPPLLDPSAGELYAFVSYSHQADGGHDAAVFQFAESFTNGSLGGSNNTGAWETLGAGGASSDISTYSGTFDNTYFTSSTASSPSGFLWVCGNTGGSPTLYAVQISSNAFSNNEGAATTGPVVSATTTTCSPVTELCVTTTGVACASGTDTSTSVTPHQSDYIFVSPETEPSSGQVTGCTASEGCVISYTMTTAPAATLSGAGGFTGGASGMIVDTQNTTVSGTLQLYFGILGSQSCTGAGGEGTGTGGCAIQAPLSAP